MTGPRPGLVLEHLIALGGAGFNDAWTTTKAFLPLVIFSFKGGCHNFQYSKKGILTFFRI